MKTSPLWGQFLRWPEVEDEPDWWGPHVSEWREREEAGVFWDIREYMDLQSPARGPDAVKYVENGTVQGEEEL